MCNKKKVSQSNTEYSQSSTEEKKLSERLYAIKKKFHRVPQSSTEEKIL